MPRLTKDFLCFFFLNARHLDFLLMQFDLRILLVVHLVEVEVEDNFPGKKTLGR